MESLLGRNSRESSLRLFFGHIFGVDYWVGRYVDDYFIFCGNENIASVVQNQIEIQLEKFNLRLNRAKQIDFEGPSFSPIHTAKQRIARQMSNHFTRANEFVSSLDRPNKAPNVNKLISGYKSVLHDLNVVPADVNNFTLGIIEKRIARVKRDLVVGSREGSEALARILKDAVVLVEFLYLAAPSVPSALRATRILLQHVRISEKAHFGRDLRLSVLGEIDRTCIAVLNRHSHEAPDQVGAERFYWLLLHAELGRPLLLTEAELRKFVVKSFSNDGDYLSIVSMLLYLRKRKRYNALRIEICESIAEVVDKLHPESAERAMLQSDVIACPYIEHSYKMDWLSLWFPKQNTASNADAIRDWPESVYAAWSTFDLDEALRAKKRRDVY
jgi:hypothetical protein